MMVTVAFFHILDESCSVCVNYYELGNARQLSFSSTWRMRYHKHLKVKHYKLAPPYFAFL